MAFENFSQTFLKTTKKKDEIISSSFSEFKKTFGDTKIPTFTDIAQKIEQTSPIQSEIPKSNLSKISDFASTAFAKTTNIIEQTTARPDYEINPPSDDSFKNFTRELPSSIVENLPFGVGEIIRIARDEPGTIANLSWSDVAKGLPEAGTNILKSFAINPFLTVAGGLLAPVLKDYGGHLKFNIPGLGEVSSAQARAYDAVQNGKSWGQAALEEAPNAIFDTLAVIGIVQTVTAPKHVAIKRAESPEGIKVSKPAKSFREYVPAKGNTSILNDAQVQAIAKQKNIDLGPKYNPNNPTYFRLREGMTGKIIPEIVQIKPSYLSRFMDLFKGDISKVPETGVIPIYSQSISVQDIPIARPINQPIRIVPVKSEPLGIVETIKKLEKTSEITTDQNGNKVIKITPKSERIIPKEQQPLIEKAQQLDTTQARIDYWNLIAKENLPTEPIYKLATEQQSAEISNITSNLEVKFGDDTSVILREIGINNQNIESSIQAIRDVNKNLETKIESVYNILADKERKPNITNVNLGRNEDNPFQKMKAEGQIDEKILEKTKDFFITLKETIEKPIPSKIPEKSIKQEISRTVPLDIQNASANVFTELELSQKGERIFVPAKIGGGLEVKGVSSTFPDWITDKELRSKKLFESVTEKIQKGEEKFTAKEKRLLEVIKEEIAIRTKRTKAELTNELLYGETYKGEEIKINEGEDFQTLSDKEMPSYSGGGEGFSIGVFEDGTPIKLGSMNSIKPMEVPEMVRFVRELIGKFPIIKEKMRDKLGFFSGKQGNIFLRADQFKEGNASQLSKLFAHEIGHLVDWLPDQTLTRGNLLGHLLALKKFTASVFSKGGEESLFGKTEAGALDLKKIRDDVTKKVLKEKGISFGEYITDKEIRDSLKKEISLRMEEIKSEEGNIQNAIIAQELQKVTEFWRPYNKETSSKQYLEYRKKPSEIYADAHSMLLNNPGLLEEMAPTFYKEFFNALDARPEVKASFFSLQELLNGSSEEIFKARMADIQKGFERAEAIQAEFKAKKKLGNMIGWEKFRQQVDDVNYPILKKQYESEVKGKIFGEEENLKFILEEKSLVDNENFLLVEKIDKDIRHPIEKAGMTNEDLGTYLLLDRIRTGRSDIANPYGFNPKNANEQLDFLKKGLGDKKYDLLQKKAKEFHEIIFKSVEEAVRVGSYNQEIFETKILPNKDNYAAFQVVDYMQEHMPATVKGQIGTFKEVSNPFVSTILKTISLNRLNAYQRAKNSTIKLLQNDYPGEITETKTITTDGRLHVFRPAEGMGTIEVLEDGKMASYDVDPYIGESFRNDRVGDLNMAVALIEKFNNKLFKPIVTTYNLGFAAGTNPIRDFRRNYKNIPNATIFNLLTEYVKSLPSAYRYASGKLDDFTKTLVESKAISSPINDYNFDAVDTEFKNILEKYRIIKEQAPNTLRNMIVKPINMVLGKIKFVANTLESISKIAGAKIRIEGGESGKELAYNIRNYTGTPNFRIRGTQTKTTNAVFVFSNIIKESIKSDLRIATNPKTRSGYWWKTVKIDFLPKFLMFAAAAGLLGPEIKKWMDKVTEYDKTNYTIIPLGTDDNGKAVYFRLPHDETGRLFSAMLWKMMNFAKDGYIESGQQILSLGAGQFPSISPILQIGTGWLQYATGRNPYDGFRGRQVIDDTTWNAGGGSALKKMVQWTSNNLGFTKFATYDTSKNTTLETFLQTAPWFSSLIKISDYGLQEKYSKPAKEQQQIEAKNLLRKKDVIARYVKLGEKENKTSGQIISSYGKDIIIESLGYTPTTKEDFKKAKNILLDFNESLTVKGLNNPRIDVLLKASSNAQQATSLRAIQADMSTGEFKDFLKVIIGNKIIPMSVLEKIDLKSLMP